MVATIERAGRFAMIATKPVAYYDDGSPGVVQKSDDRATLDPAAAGFGFGGMRQPREIALTALLRLAEQSPGRLPKC